MASTRLVFLIQGSAAEPYEVSFVKDGKNITTFCTCPAGKFGQWCKHRVALLAAQTEKVVNPNPVDLDALQSWIIGTDVETAVRDYVDAERELEKAKARSAKCKKALARSLAD